MRGHRQGRNEEGGVMWPVSPGPSHLRIEERELDAGGLS